MQPKPFSRVPVGSIASGRNQTQSPPRNFEVLWSGLGRRVGAVILGLSITGILGQVPSAGVDLDFPDYVQSIDREALALFGQLSENVESVKINGKTAEIFGRHFSVSNLPLTSDQLRIEINKADGTTYDLLETYSLVREPLGNQPLAIPLGSGLMIPKEGIDPSLIGKLRRRMRGESPTLLPNEERANSVHAIVQFREKLSLRKARAAFPGLRFLEQLPGGAWVASVNENDIARLQSSDLTRSAFSPAASHKIAIDLANLPATARTETEALNVRVRFYPDVTAEEAQRALEASDIAIGKNSAGMFNDWPIRAPRGALLKLQTFDSVMYIDEATPEPARDNNHSRQNARVESLFFPPYSLTGVGGTAGIWDGGLVDLDHPDFNGRLKGLENVPEDDHATHVAGTMAGDGAADPNDRGHLRGMAPELRVVSRDFHGPTAEEHEAAIKAEDIDISQNSWGYRNDSDFTGNYVGTYLGQYTLLARKYDSIVHGVYDRRIPVVFSAGNEQQKYVSGPFGTVNNPGGTGKNIISVGAIENDTNQIASFSSLGPTDDGRLKPDLVAPGARGGGRHGIVSTIPRGVDVDDLTNNAPGVPNWGADGADDYFFPYSNSVAGLGESVAAGDPPASEGVWEGTSMAAPVVSGVIALMLEEFRMSHGASPDSDIRPLPSTFKAILTNTAEDLTNALSATNFIGPDYVHGFGRLNATDAILMVRNKDYIEGEILSEGIAGRRIHELAIPPGITEWKVNLAWDDPPGAEDVDSNTHSHSKLVNDLDLVLIAPDGTRHYPWVLNPQHPRRPATRAIRVAAAPVVIEDNDHLNNCVQITIDNPRSGKWEAHVWSDSLNHDLQPQTYSLAAPQTFRDAFIRDLALDRGQRGSPAPWWNSPDIKIIQNDDDAWSVRITVHNRGYLPISGAKLELYTVPATTSLPSFQRRSAGDVENWTYVGGVESFDLPSSESVDVDLDWPTEFIEAHRLPNQMCLAALIHGDGEIPDFSTNTNLSRLARDHNNLAYRNARYMAASESGARSFVRLSGLVDRSERSLLIDAQNISSSVLVSIAAMEAASDTPQPSTSSAFVENGRFKMLDRLTPGFLPSAPDQTQVGIKVSRDGESSISQDSVLQLLEQDQGNVTGGLSVIFEIE